MLGVDWEFAVPLHARNIWIGPGATITATGASEAPEIANASKTRCHDSAESGSPTGGARGASAVMNVADVNSASKLRDANPAQLAGLVDRIASGLSASVAVAGHPPVTVSIGVSHSSLARPSGFLLAAADRETYAEKRRRSPAQAALGEQIRGGLPVLGSSSGVEGDRLTP